MIESDDAARARALISEAIALCDRLGRGMVVPHLQLALDRLEESQTILRQRQSPWPLDD
ncbi:hypothetical protein [Sphingomonas sp. dw_22]|uniref:hypothetical protein n=1 Tax=Sphingomonas sp. dw_22 TaxID=2721175 RepID=UPI001BD5A800|nr:hypothetical protein [Sphingomonas sp. dw_22]